jgi:hypothetical protein
MMACFSDVWALIGMRTFERRRTELTGDVPFALTAEFSEDRERQRLRVGSEAK